MKIGTLTSATMMQKPTSTLTPVAAETLRLEKIRRLRMGSLIRRCENRKITKATTDPTTQYIRCCAGPVDTSEAISGEPRPTLSRTSARPRSVTPIQSMPPFAPPGNPARPHQVTANITAIMGRLIQKRYGQVMNCTMIPPYKWPRTQPVVSTAPTIPRGSARFSGGKRSATSAMLTGTIAPAPNAWMTRPKINAYNGANAGSNLSFWNAVKMLDAIRAGQPGEAATSHEPTKKMTRHTRYTTRRPETSDTLPMKVMLIAYETK